MYDFAVVFSTVNKQLKEIRDVSAEEKSAEGNTDKQI